MIETMDLLKTTNQVLISHFGGGTGGGISHAKVNAIIPQAVVCGSLIIALWCYWRLQRFFAHLFGEPVTPWREGAGGGIGRSSNTHPLYLQASCLQFTHTSTPVLAVSLMGETSSFNLSSREGRIIKWSHSLITYRNKNYSLQKEALR